MNKKTLGIETMQSKIRDSGKNVMQSSFSRKEQIFFIRDCFNFIRENNSETHTKLQEILSVWVADRRRQYGIPLNQNEVSQFEFIKSSHPYYKLHVRK